MGYSSWALKQLGFFLTDAKKSNMIATFLYSQLLHKMFQLETVYFFPALQRLQ